MKRTTWGYYDDEGRPHLGRELDAPEELTWHDEERVCARCRLPSHWRTARGRVTHPTCDPRALHDRLSPTEQRRTERMAARILGAEIDREYTPPGRRPRAVAYSGEPCSICDSTRQTLSYLLIQPHRPAYRAIRCKRHTMTREEPT